MAKNPAPWLTFFLVRFIGVLKHSVRPHPSLMTKNEFVYSRLATRLAFFTAGIATSPWASLVPYVKMRQNLDEMHYASLVLCFGLGAVIGMPLTGRLAARFGVKPIILISCVTLYLGMTGLSLESLTLPLSFLFVIMWGMSLGIIDVANNIHGAYIEERAGRHLMSSFHAWYTVGCIVAALFCALALHLGLHSTAVSLMLSGAGIILLVYFYGKLINTHGEGSAGDEERETPSHKKTGLIPSYLTLPVLIIGAICLIMYLTEGMIYDWSSVYLIQNGGLDITIASVGYLAFEGAVALMRFRGDAIVTACGPLKLIVGGALLACAGMVTIALSHSPYVLVGAFFICGLALANVVPVMLSETARLAGAQQGKAISFVGTLGYSGLLLGPGILGAVATVFGLSAMYVLTAALIFLLGLMALYVLTRIQ